MSNEFIEWPKTTRLYSPVCISEKIDGTCSTFVYDDLTDTFFCQSRKKVITPKDDNAGFAAWAYKNADMLKEELGPGYHYGEWWGQGIQRKYSMTEKRFSLFNTRRWAGWEFKTPQLYTVPVLYSGEFTDSCVQEACQQLKTTGSLASPGFMNVEGVCVFWEHNNMVLKVPFGK